MQRKERINSAPLYNDEDQDIRSTMFYVPTIYSDKVKIHDWHMKTLSEPRDNMDIFPPCGNLHRSSYRRFGTEDADGIGISETQTMLSQIELKDEYKPTVCTRRGLFAMQSLASAKKEYEEKEPKLTDVLLDRVCPTDYRTTTSDDYRLPYPLKPKPPVSPPLPSSESWLLNRFTVGYSPQDLENRHGYRTFLDDDMDLHRRIAELKMRRGKLHEIF